VNTPSLINVFISRVQHTAFGVKEPFLSVNFYQIFTQIKCSVNIACEMTLQKMHKVRYTHTHTHNRFTAGLEYVR